MHEWLHDHHLSAALFRSKRWKLENKHSTFAAVIDVGYFRFFIQTSIIRLRIILGEILTSREREIFRNLLDQI